MRRDVLLENPVVNSGNKPYWVTEPLYCEICGSKIDNGEKDNRYDCHYQCLQDAKNNRQLLQDFVKEFADEFYDFIKN